MLANQHCRFVLSYFKDASEEVASVADLSTAFARKNGIDRNQAAIQFHHTAFPKLEGAGVVDYDTRSETVRYHGHSRLEDWHARIVESEYEHAVEGS